MNIYEILATICLAMATVLALVVASFTAFWHLFYYHRRSRHPIRNTMIASVAFIWVFSSCIINLF